MWKVLFIYITKLGEGFKGKALTFICLFYSHNYGQHKNLHNKSYDRIVTPRSELQVLYYLLSRLTIHHKNSCNLKK